MTTAAGVEEPRRRWWLVVRDEVRYEVEIVAWENGGAIVIPLIPDWDGRLIGARASELRGKDPRP